MGGNALSHTSVRLTKNNYERMAQDCVARLQAAFPGKRVHAIEAYAAKADFGDLDILIESEGYDPLKAAEALAAVEVVRNGPVTSVGVRVRPEVAELDGNVFQVDLIANPAESFDFARCYFAFNDLGNLVGRIAHAMGVAFRHDGLVFYCRDGDYKFAEIVLTRNFDEALEFLGYSPLRYHEGFRDLEDIFQFVVSSPFFSRNIFLLENRNNRSRVRDRKRPTYMEFLKWCEQPNLPTFEFPADKGHWYGRIATFFPHFETEHRQVLEDLALQRAVKAKFSGEWVSELTGLKGKELGALMKRFRESFASAEEQRAYVLRSTPAELAMRVRQLLGTLTTPSSGA